MTLEELIAQTRARAGSSQPLDLLVSAAQQQQELTDLGERLLDHFVQEARAAACPWSQIGTALGVTKQAAQQRHSSVRSLLGRLKDHVESWGPFRRFTPGARQVVLLAQEEARQLCHEHLGTEHLLLGLLAESRGLGARALRGAGITLDTARAGIVEMVGRGHDTPSGHIPFAPRAKKALELALRESLHLRHNYIGTEHILLGLLREGEGIGTQLITAADVQPNDLRDSLLALIDQE
ncbi:MAG: Clp protease N-terminal domain-containing protein [Pseudonocardiales bacterium]